MLYTTRSLLRAVPRQKVTTYLPSYLFASLIGFLPAPYTLDVFFRLLAHFLTTPAPPDSPETPDSR